MADTQGRPYPSGPYTPGDEPPLAFERRRPPRAERPRRAGPPPVTLILSAILLLGVGGAVAFMYRAGLRPPGGAPHPVGTPIGEVRVAAPPQAQPADPAAGLTIYKEGPPPAAPAFTPAPEQPMSRVAEPATPPPAPAASAAPIAVTAAPATKAPPPSEATAKSAAKAKPKSIDALLAQATPAAGGRKPTGKHEQKPVDASATAKPAAKTAAAKKSGKDVDTAKADSPTDKSGHAPVVQIGAFSSRALAEAAASKGASGHAKRIVAITKPDGTVLYRASLTGFASRDDAGAFCGKLKAGGSSCFVPR